MRTQKTDNGDTTYYYYDSNKNLIALTKGNYTLLFNYDSDGNVTSFIYSGFGCSNQWLIRLGKIRRIV